MFTIHRTRAFRNFQKSVGNFTAHINTAYVGTELIALGTKKPDNLRIRWQEPNDARNFIHETRSLLHAAMLGYVFTAVERFLRDLADDKWLKLEPAKCDILRKAVTKQGGSAYSITERFSQLDLELEPRASWDALLVEVLVVWRNRNVHEKSAKKDNEEMSDSRLSKDSRKSLKEFSDQIHSQYGGMNVEELIKHLDQNKAPSRKELVGIVSAAQNYVRMVDNGLIKRAVRSEMSLALIAKQEIYDNLSRDDGKAIELLWGKDREARERRFQAILLEAGFTDVEKKRIVNISLPEDFISGIASLSTAEQAREYLKN
jgi:hypothetical protein